MKSNRYTEVMPTPLLMIEDDARLAQMVSDYLGQSGFQVTHAPDGEQGLEQLPLVQPELVILDLMMPGIDGLEVCRRIRAMPGDAARVPIIMLTAKGDPMDRIIGLELGADDYLPKPFVPRELLARVRSVLRRTRALPPNLDASPPANARALHFAHWQLDTVNRHLVDADGTVVPLSGAEYRMLSVFLSHPQKVLSRDQLMELTQGREADIFDRSIDLLVSRLRQRLGDNARESSIIKTVRNEGYVLATEVSIAAGTTSAKA